MYFMASLPYFWRTVNTIQRTHFSCATLDYATLILLVRKMLAVLQSHIAEQQKYLHIHAQRISRIFNCLRIPYLFGPNFEPPPNHLNQDLEIFPHVQAFFQYVPHCFRNKLDLHNQFFTSPTLISSLADVGINGGCHRLSHSCSPLTTISERCDPLSPCFLSRCNKLQ